MTTSMLVKDCCKAARCRRQCVPKTHPFLLMPENTKDASMLATVMTVANKARSVAVELDAWPNSSMSPVDPTYFAMLSISDAMLTSKIHMMRES